MKVNRQKEYPPHKCLLCETMTRRKTYCDTHWHYISGIGRNPSKRNMDAITADFHEGVGRRNENINKMRGGNNGI